MVGTGMFVTMLATWHHITVPKLSTCPLAHGSSPTKMDDQIYLFKIFITPAYKSQKKKQLESNCPKTFVRLKSTICKKKVHLYFWCWQNIDFQWLNYLTLENFALSYAYDHGPSWRKKKYLLKYLFDYFIFF